LSSVTEQVLPPKSEKKQKNCTPPSCLPTSDAIAELFSQGGRQVRRLERRFRRTSCVLVGGHPDVAYPSPSCPPLAAARLRGNARRMRRFAGFFLLGKGGWICFLISASTGITYQARCGATNAAIKSISSGEYKVTPFRACFATMIANPIRR